MFWKTNLEELIKKYCELRKAKNIVGLALLVPSLIKEVPKILKYLLTTLDSMIGMHLVYIVTFENEGFENVFKQGYTKRRYDLTIQKNIQKRFDEKRWYVDGKKLNVKDVIQYYELPAKGAVEFENFIKEKLSPSGMMEINSPGKGEFYDSNDLNNVLELMNNSVDKYKNMWEVKSPN